MLRVVVYINFTPIIDTHAVRITPPNPRNGQMCNYRAEDGKYIKQPYDMGAGAAKLAIKLLKRFTTKRAH